MNFVLEETKEKKSEFIKILQKVCAHLKKQSCSTFGGCPGEVVVAL